MLDTSPTIVVVVALYLLATIGIGVWATRRTKTTSDFLVAGRNLGMFVMSIAVFASIQSGFGVLGGTGMAFTDGLVFVSGIGLAAVLGFGLAWFLVGKRLWRMGNEEEVYTLGDVVERRYRSPAARGWIAVAVALGVIGYLGTQVQAMGVVMASIFGISPTSGALIGLGILAVYAIGGGTIAAVYTDVFQGVLLVVVSVVTFFVAVSAVGGMADITTTLQSEDPALASAFGALPAVNIACWIFLFAVGAAAQPQLLTKFLMIRDTTQLKWGALTAGIAYVCTMFLVVGVGLSALALSIRGDFPAVDTPDQALIVFMSDYTPPVLAGLALAAILAAIMSTGDAFATLGAASLVRDLPRAFGLRVRNELLWSRVAVAALLVASVLFSLYLDTLVALLGVFGWGTFAAAIFPAVVLGLVWSRATKAAAITSIVLSLVINFVLEVGQLHGFAPLPEGVVNGAFALAASTVLFIVVSLLTRPQPAGGRDEPTGEVAQPHSP
ncbi:sodium:solute symporter family transporter [Halostreptopolyspora alba]|uniref:Sodium:solute symporter n=1 Tax=Halostreptopolyspora alba TaxID=2487137 RepID=A0A3N0DYP1_9ACTN|nr:sodium:solute symporter [Nocardiopsaceae bacterium YIM 96095]